MQRVHDRALVRLRRHRYLDAHRAQLGPPPVPLLLAPLDAAAGVSQADVHCALAETLLRRGDRVRAHEAVLLALAGDPRHAQALKLRAQISGPPKAGRG